MAKVLCISDIHYNSTDDPPPGGGATDDSEPTDSSKTKPTEPC